METLRNPPKLDKWVMNLDGSKKYRLTRFNDPSSSEYVSVQGGVGIAESTWGPDEKTVIAKFRAGRGRKGTKIVLIELEYQ